MDPTALLVPLLLAHPDALRAALIVLAIGTAFSFAWKLQPTERRDAFERAHPRIAGVIRIVVALWPSLVDASRAASIQVAQGKPKGAAPVTAVSIDPAALERYVLSLQRPLDDRGTRVDIAAQPPHVRGLR